MICYLVYLLVPKMFGMPNDVVFRDSMAFLGSFELMVEIAAVLVVIGASIWALLVAWWEDQHEAR